MAEHMESLQNLAAAFGSLSGVGRKTAMRMAYAVLDLPEEDAQAFAEAILEAKRKIHLCPICMNLTDREVCSVCGDENRDKSVICVVEDPKTVVAMEKVREYHGVYHVLHGVLSPMKGITPDRLMIGALLERLNSGEVKELIVATNPTVEGEATAMYLSRLVRDRGIRVTRLAYGVPVGSDLEYADENTLYRALQGRQNLENP